MGIFTRRAHLGSEADRTTFRTLHTASRAAAALRDGLTESSAERALKPLHALLGAPVVALADSERVLAWDGPSARRAHQHRDQGDRAAASMAAEGRTIVLGGPRFACGDPTCDISRGLVVPLVVGDHVVGSLLVFGSHVSAGLLRATEEVAEWVSSQLALTELDSSRARLAEAEVKALRAQISPHFVYNSLTAIASFVRTDPDRARELLVEFADFTRYSFRRHGEFTTLAEELRSIEQYLTLERARFGDRLGVRLQVAPEVLPVAIPFLCLQPLVENAVRHGLEGSVGAVTITIEARDQDRECVISVEDDGAGEDPERVRRALAGNHPAIDSVGLGNVDERLRAAFGAEHGLVVETALGAGTKVTVRVPKYAPGVQAS